MKKLILLLGAPLLLSACAKPAEKAPPDKTSASASASEAAPDVVYRLSGVDNGDHPS